MNSNRASQPRSVDYLAKVVTGMKCNEVHVQRVGHYKEIEKEQVISAKRAVDKLMYSNQAFFSPEFFDAYEDYMSSAFETYRGEGLDARPKSPSAKHRNLYSRLMKEFNEEFN